MTERWEQIAHELGSYEMTTQGGWVPHTFMAEVAPADCYVGDWVRAKDACRRIERAEERIRAWTDGVEPPALEDDSAVGPPDIAELIEAAPRFTGEREGGPVTVELEPYEAVVSRSEFVAYGRALAWQQRRIAELEATAKGLSQAAARLESDREYNAGLVAERDERIAELEEQLRDKA